jgi:hypothetical protein
MLQNAEVEIAHSPILANAADAGSKIVKSVPEETEEEAAAGYLFELLVAARRLAVTRQHRFLAYLIGMAVEESRLLTQGRSALGR